MKKDLTAQNLARQELNKKLLAGEVDFATALKLIRKMLGVNQVQYAKFVGVTTKVIAELELGRGNPTVATLNRIFAPIGFRVGLVPKNR